MQDICRVPSRPANIPEVSRGRRLPYLDVHHARRSSGMAHPCPRGCISRRSSAILAYRGAALRHLGVAIHELCLARPHRISTGCLVSQSVGMAPDHAATGRLQHGRYDSASTKAAPELSSYHPCRCCAPGRFSAPSLPDSPHRRHAAEGDFGRFRPPAGSDGALRLIPRAQRTPPRRGASSRWRGSPPCRAGRGSPPAGRSGRSRRPSAAPAPRCRDRPPVPPHAAVGRRLVAIDVHEAARRRERRQRALALSRIPWPANGSTAWAELAATAAGTTTSPPAPGPPRRDACPRCRRTSSARPSHQ